VSINVTKIFANENLAQNMCCCFTTKIDHNISFQEKHQLLEENW
jgi:hypothetical protein